MTTTEIHALRPNLPPLPDHMKALPIDSRGFPIPWFVATLEDGTRDFRIADTEKRQRAVDRDLCWVCGNRVRRVYTFVVGPMCVCTGTTSEPACHIDCALFSAQACPFLTQPRMRRNEKDLDDTGAVPAPGNHITRNPGASAVYITRGYRTFPVGRGQWLIRMGAPEKIHWFAQGRVASRGEVQASIDSGLPLLRAEARKERDVAGALAQLAGCVDRMQAWLPA